MRFSRCRICSKLLLALLLSMTTSPAYAYFDPGTGSVILQLLIGGVGGALVIGKLYWNKILGFFGMRRDRDDAARHDDKPID